MRRLFFTMLIAAGCGISASANTAPLSHPVRGVPEAHLVQQGLAQYDLSLRGSSYTGSGLLLNGLALPNPYSAHFNSTLLLPDALLSTPRVVSGVKNLSRYPVGALSYRTTPTDPGGEFSIAAGSPERYYLGGLTGNGPITGFFSAEKARRIDYSANDMERMNGGALLQHEHEGWAYSMLTAVETKSFGAQGYYGIPSTVYAEEETEEGLLLLTAERGDLDDAYFRTTAGVRLFDDRYTLPSTLFSSDVRSRQGSLMVEGQTMEIQHWVLHLRGELSHERVSGDIGSHDRTRGSLVLLPEARFEQVRFKAGVEIVAQSDESPDGLPLGSVEWLLSDNSMLSVAYSESEQQPDYQSLYFTDGLYRVGNPLLRQQRMQQSEVGFQQFVSEQLDWRASAFYRRLQEATDWTQTTAGGTWSATSLGTLDMVGMDARATYRSSDRLGIELFYQWLEKESAPIYAGLYELDYPEHLLMLSIRWQMLEELETVFSQRALYQTANRAREGRRSAAQASLSLQYTPRFADNMRFWVLMENLWNSDFQALPGLEPLPPSVSGGITVTW